LAQQKGAGAPVAMLWQQSDIKDMKFLAAAVQI
jgi:hypothetical protein